MKATTMSFYRMKNWLKNSDKISIKSQLNFYFPQIKEKITTFNNFQRNCPSPRPSVLSHRLRLKLEFRLKVPPFLDNFGRVLWQFRDISVREKKDIKFGKNKSFEFFMAVKIFIWLKIVLILILKCKQKNFAFQN